jgi:hypothetical protein
MSVYVDKCVQVPAPAPAWCDEAQNALDELRAADQAAQAAVGLKGSAAPQRTRLNAAIEWVDRVFNGR